MASRAVPVSAQFISADRAVDGAPPSNPMEYDSKTSAQGGRLVMIAVDSTWYRPFTRDAATAHAAAILPDKRRSVYRFAPTSRSPRSLEMFVLLAAFRAAPLKEHRATPRYQPM